MTLEERIIQRSESKCELCQSIDNLTFYDVTPQGGYEESTVLLCNKCLRQIEKKEALNSNHWHILSTVMWSEVPGIQVICWRLLNRLKHESWAAENLEMMYMDDEKLSWAGATGDHENENNIAFHTDTYGALLHDGDTVVLTKSLNVKGTTLNAKVGTVIKNIHLVKDNPHQIEGRIEGQMIVVLTQYVRRQAPKNI